MKLTPVEPLITNEKMALILQLPEAERDAALRYIHATEQKFKANKLFMWADTEGEGWVVILDTESDLAPPLATGLVFWHLSIRHGEREPIRDWRVFQDIKNQTVGPEFEAAELFPAEDRLVDVANQYHLWVLAGPVNAGGERPRFPFGWGMRSVSGPEDAARFGAVQRDEDAPTARREAERVFSPRTPNRAERRRMGRVRKEGR